MPTMHIIEFHHNIEEIIHRQVKGNVPHEWDEDFITRNIVKDLRNRFADVAIEGLKNPIRIKIHAYKFIGRREQKYGDIGVIVNLRYADGDALEGVGFLEAKKRAKRKMQFEALNQNQLQRIIGNAPHSLVLLYDYDDIPHYAVKSDGYHPWDNGLEDYYAWTPYTYAVVIPTNVVLKAKSNDTSLYKYASPFSHQLCFRYLFGWDLDFQQEALDIAKGNKEEAPQYLLAISIGHGGAEPTPAIEINHNVFTEKES